MMVSIITVAKNSSRTISRTMTSVILQSYVDVEHIVKDAVSDDKTVEISLKVNPKAVIVSKPDLGIYDAMNQGFFASTGDIVAFLNSDDFYADEKVLEDVVNVFVSTGCDFVYGNISMISPSGQTLREWKSDKAESSVSYFRQIPHPALFIRRSVLKSLNVPFDDSYRIAADLKQQLLLIKKMGFKGRHLDRVLTYMELGGESTNSLGAYVKGWKESARAYNEVMGSGGALFVLRKVLSKFDGLQFNFLFSVGK